MHRHEARVYTARVTSQVPVNFCTMRQPAHTGMREALRVFGLAAKNADVMKFMRES